MRAAVTADHGGMTGTGNPADSRVALRILAAVVALPLTAYALLCLVGMLARGFDLLSAMFFLFPGTLAAFCWWFALRGHLTEGRGRMRMALLGGIILGGIGFVAGFLGPIILTPEANQGPLLGIFFTGPLGFVVGCVAGWLYAHMRSRTPGDQSGTSERGSRAA